VGEGNIATATAIETGIKIVITTSEATIAMTEAATLTVIAAIAIGIDMIAIDMIVTDMIVTATSEIATTIVSTNVETTITVAKSLQAVGGACMSCSAFLFCAKEHAFCVRGISSQQYPTELYKTKLQPRRQTRSRSVLTYKSRKSGAKT